MALDIENMSFDDLKKQAKKMKVEFADDITLEALKALVIEKMNDVEEDKKAGNPPPQKKEGASATTTSKNLEEINVKAEAGTLPEGGKTVKLRTLKETGRFFNGGQWYNLPKNWEGTLPFGVAADLINTGGAVEIK